MTSPPTGKKTRKTSDFSTKRLSETYRLERHSWRNWFLLAAVAIITTIGLITAMPPLFSGHIINIWPWAKTELALLFGLSLTVLIFVVYLTQQQHMVVTMRRRLQEMEDETVKHSRRYTARLYALLNVSRIMSTETNPQGVFDCITRMCAEIFDCNRASLMLFDKKTRDLVIRSTSDEASDELLLNRKQKIGVGIAGWVAQHREPLLLGDKTDMEKYPGLNFADPNIIAAMLVPIILRDELVGVLNISTHSPDVKYEREDLQALQVFAENVGACIRHTEQAVWMRQTIAKLRQTVPSKS